MEVFLYILKNIKGVWIAGVATIVFVVAVFATGAYWQHGRDAQERASAPVKIDTVFHVDTIKTPPIKIKDIPAKPIDNPHIAIYDSAFVASLNDGLASLRKEYIRVCNPVTIDTTVNGVRLHMEYMPFERMAPVLEIELPPKEVKTVTVTIEKLIEIDVPWYKYGYYVVGGAVVTAIIFLAAK